MNIEQYQNLIIGSGEAGKYLAWTLAKLGQKTIVVERSFIGGSCPNIACLPSKNVIYSAKVASLVARAGEFGISTGPINLDMAAVTARKKKMVGDLRKIHQTLYESSGAELLLGEAKFVEPKTVRVAMNAGGERMIRGQRVFLAVGTRATIPPLPGLAEARPLTHVEALDLERLPSHLVILGGGYIGLEFAQALRRFGSRVTIIQHADRLLNHGDADVSDALGQLFKDEGIDVLLTTEIVRVSGLSGQGVTIELKTGTSARTIKASDILVATGRTPNSDTLDIGNAGVEIDSHGFIRVNDRLQTSAADVWAMGECAGTPQFTHVGYDDFRIVRDNLAGGNRSTTGRLIPYCLFTDPELAHVGMSETEARAKSVRYRRFSIPIAMVLRTRTTSETRGFIKALVGEDDRILGLTAFGAEASELLAAAQTAILGRLPYTLLRDGIFTHPTIAEGLVVLFSSKPTTIDGR